MYAARRWCCRLIWVNAQPPELMSLLPMRNVAFDNLSRTRPNEATERLIRTGCLLYRTMPWGETVKISTQSRGTVAPRVPFTPRRCCGDSRMRGALARRRRGRFLLGHQDAGCRETSPGALLTNKQRIAAHGLHGTTALEQPGQPAGLGCTGDASGNRQRNHARTARRGAAHDQTRSGAPTTRPCVHIRRRVRLGRYRQPNRQSLRRNMRHP